MTNPEHDAILGSSAPHPIPRLLRRTMLEPRIDSFIDLGKDVPGEYWSAENFLRDVPGKWDFSLASFDARQNVLGYAVASRPEPEFVHLHHLMVRAELRGHGIGATLVRELSHRTALAGAATLRLKVHERNSGALRFYEREGFAYEAPSGEYRVLRAPARKVQRRVAIHQPNYLPWCGYFSKCAKADVFVVLDDAQMPTGRSYVYRTRVAAQKGGAQWLSIPTSRAATDSILAVRFADEPWARKHVATLRALYGKRPRFKEVFDWLEPLIANPGENLSTFNERANRAVCKYLGLSTPFVSSSAFGLSSASDDRLIDLVREVGGTAYLSGRGGQNYQDPVKFANAGIRLEVRVYTPVAYAQGREPFEPGLSVVDALFNVGRDTVALLG